MNELVSVIIPIYNVECYLDRCLKSVINQTYKNLQIILVDDGSPDKCGEKCDYYAKQDNRIEVIHKINGGLSDARNVGIDNALGEWIVFVDSDDYISPQFVEILYDCAIKSECDIVQCKYDRFSDEIFEKKYNECSHINIIKSKDHLHNIDTATNTAVWNKIYRKTLFEKIRFPYGKIHEDVATTFKLVYLAKKICSIDYELYHYFINPNSITTSKIKNNKVDLIDAYWEQVSYYMNNYDCREYQIEATNKLMASFGSLLAFPKSRYSNYKEFYNNLEKKYKLLRKKLIYCPMRVDLKLLLIISPKSLVLFKIIHKIKTIIHSR